MSKILNGGKVKNHTVKPYKFKELNENETKNAYEEINYEKKEEIKENNTIQKNEEQNKIIENLLLKIEELSNKISNIQSEFQAQIQECNKKAELQKQESYEKGKKEGIEEGRKICEEEMKEKIALLESSIEKLDKINDTFEEKILSVEKELISVALDIAKEVIQKEVSKESEKIAYSLAKSLMEDIKEATKIKLKVNPKDAEFLKDKFKNVEIIPDEAIKEGGVVIMSDLGNIDAEIKERFDAVKKAILESNSEG